MNKIDLYRLYEEDGFQKQYCKRQLEGIYQDEVDKNIYEDFEDWFFDMLKSGIIRQLYLDTK